jgi:hypothetical protein
MNCQQTISICGVNVPWQNRVAEKRIHDLQESATTMLLYAQQHWPDAIDKALWPYALCHANNIHNSAPLKDKKLSPLEQCCGSYIAPQLHNFHHFGCPAYVLNNKLQQGKKSKK